MRTIDELKVQMEEASTAFSIAKREYETALCALYQQPKVGQRFRFILSGFLVEISSIDTFFGVPVPIYRWVLKDGTLGENEHRKFKWDEWEEVE